MNVNDLAERFFNDASPNDATKWAYADAGMALRSLARTAWHPITDPPTEEDGDENGLVLVRYPACEGDPAGTIMFPWWQIEGVEFMDEIDEKLLWARIYDVILMPQGGE